MRCKAKTRSGGACGAFAVNGSRYCFTHSPARGRERAQAHKLGGQHRRRVVNDSPFPTCDVKTAAGLLSFLEDVMREAWALESSVARSRTLGYLAQVQKGVIEIGELELRVSALENSLKLREGAKP